MLSVNFGAVIHRVVGLDLSDPVFAPHEASLRTPGQPGLDLLLAELRKGPAILRLSYLADTKDPRLVEARIAAIGAEIQARWRMLNCCYRLSIEPEGFWRRGAPPDKP